ncbi:membrane associated with a RING finger [Cryptosporidium bovis]|uniref:membrane associated with a RING finger n=1 Tax=Cryptosporidium bovis TaxID=310047 RepID=UPI00351A99A1|nr:membrane associated with a RING finger [Cryptosporidium bovis]
MKNERTYKNDIVSKGIHKRNNVAIFSSIKYFKNHNIFKLKFKIMLIKERINTLCRKYLNVQPLFRTSSRNVVVSPVRESSLRNIYGNGSSRNGYDCDWSNYNNNTSGAYNNGTNSSSSINGNHGTSNNISVEQESEDSLMQLVYNYPEKTLWFLNGTLNVCIISFSVMGAFSTLYVLYNWNYNYERSPYLTVWLLIHGLLQIVQVVFRVIYKFILNKESIQSSCGGRIIFILQSVKRLTQSKTWRIGRLFSILYYIWFSAGFYWILSVRPSSGEYEYDDSSGLNRLNRSDLVENSYVLSRASHYLLKSNSFELVNNLIKVDFNSNLWPFYLITMLVCTLRIIGMLFFFYFVFPSMVSSEYSENKFKAYTINKLENLPVKAYSEWKNIKERDRCNGKKHAVLQDNCIICLNDFSNEDLTRCLPCDHVFHEDCIDLWLLRNAVCPLCQTALK